MLFNLSPIISAKFINSLIYKFRRNIPKNACSTIQARKIHTAKFIKRKIKVSISALLPFKARPLKANIISDLVFLFLTLIVYTKKAGSTANAIIASRAIISFSLARKDIELTQRTLHINGIIYPGKMPTVHPATTKEETKNIFQSRII